MIINNGTISVDSGIQYISDWKDNYGNYMIEPIIAKGKVIVNKQLTGCGFTSYCLDSTKNTNNYILLSPRICLIKNKVEQFSDCFYFDRVMSGKGKKSKYKSREQLEQELLMYNQWCQSNNHPYKLLCTYDSFWLLADILETSFHSNISQDFRICVDESQSIIKDIKMKEYVNNNTMSVFLDRVFRYDNVLFISATPILTFIQKVPQFKSHPVLYYELNWPNAEKVIERPDNCRSVSDAFNTIFNYYSSHTDPNDVNVFDCYPLGDGNAKYSYEAVIFINNVSDIKKLLTRYITTLGLIQVKDISVICADTEENQKTLSEIHPALKITTSIPKKGDKHPTWTFATRTAFCGVDFYSTSASSFVIANYNVPCLSLDVSSDIPQIIGRQRRKDNVFRNTIHVFYVMNKRVISDQEFLDLQAEKKRKSQEQIDLWNDAAPERKNTALKNLNKVIESDPRSYYVSTASGKPEINPLLMIDEEYSQHIQKTCRTWFILSAGSGFSPYPFLVQKLKDDLEQISSKQIMHDRIKKTHEYFSNCPQQKDDFFVMLYNEGYNDVAHYFCHLPLDRISALGFNTTKLDKEIEARSMMSSVGDVVAIRFQKGMIYTAREVKEKLQEVYDELGLNVKAKATDLPNYIPCTKVHTKAGDNYRID